MSVPPAGKGSEADVLRDRARHALASLRELTTVVADTGDFESMRAFAPRDATTNPSLILRAVQQPIYQPLFAHVVACNTDRTDGAILERLLVRFGCEILRIVPGRVSTEVDARWSFDANATAEQARRLIALYEDEGIGRERVLIKIAATWEGIRAAERLEREGIRCNLTLIFSLTQAAACAEAGVTLISPFVGRILDWYRKHEGRDYGAEEDPGVNSVREIFHYLKAHGFATEVMGASFRSVEQVLALAGCDLLTISPDLLAELERRSGPVERRLDASNPGHLPERMDVSEPAFRYALNADAMATEKLAEGIRTFVRDAERLQAMIANRRR